MSVLTVMNKMCPQPSVQKGVALLEVLIVFFVLSVGLLGMAALQMKSMQYNQSAYIRSQANLAAYDILDRMRLNRADAISDQYNVALAAASTTASGGALAQADLAAWKLFLADTLPGGDGSVDCSSATCTITIQWTDRVLGSTVSMSVVAQL